MPTQLPLIVYETTHDATRRRLCDLPAEERPLYRLHQVGSGGLATTELLALVLGTSLAPGLAQDLLDKFGSLHRLARANKAQLCQINGIGEAQAARLLAVLELSCRLQTPAEERPGITSPADCANLLLPRIIVMWNILSATIFLLRRIFHERYLLVTISLTGRT